MQPPLEEVREFIELSEFPLSKGSVLSATDGRRVFVVFL